MQWPRDADEEVHILIRSARSLLTVMTHATVAGMVADPIVEQDTRTTSDVTAEIATATSTAPVVEIDIAIAICNTIDGVTGDRHS
jgi:hypothetical protein